MDRRTFLALLSTAVITPTVMLSGAAAKPTATPAPSVPTTLVPRASLLPMGARFPRSAWATLEQGGPDRDVVAAYDSIVAKNLFWDLGETISAPCAVDLLWRPASAAGGTVVWGVNSYAVGATVVPGTPHQRTRVTLPELADVIHISRLAYIPDDTMVGDAHLLGAVVMI
jgi:hypothetical protein